jgi:hypothetical protein
LRRTPKLLANESVEKEISNYFQKKFNENLFHERNLQEKIDYIRRIYLNHNPHSELSDQQRQHIRDLSGERDKFANVYSSYSASSKLKKRKTSHSRSKSRGK